MRRGTGWMLAAGMVLALSGCGLLRAGPNPPAADTLIVRKTSALPHNGIPSWTRTTHNAHAIAQLVDVLLALSPAPSQAISCPADFGYAYHLTFKDKGKTTLVAVADGSGCRQVSVQGRILWTMKGPFWAVLAKTLGMPEPTLFAFGRMGAERDLASGGEVAFWNNRVGLIAGNAETVPGGFVAVTTDGGRTFSETFASSDPVLSAGVGPYRS